MSEPAQEKWFCQTIHTYKPYWLIYEAHFKCHDILMLDKSPIKWKERPDMTIVVDWDVKHRFKQTNKLFASYSELDNRESSTMANHS